MFTLRVQTAKWRPFLQSTSSEHPCQSTATLWVSWSSSGTCYWASNSDMFFCPGNVPCDGVQYCFHNFGIEYNCFPALRSTPEDWPLESTTIDHYYAWPIYLEILMWKPCLPRIMSVGIRRWNGCAGHMAECINTVWTGLVVVKVLSIRKSPNRLQSST